MDSADTSSEILSESTPWTKPSSTISSDSPTSIPLCSRLLSNPFKIDAATKSQYKDIALNASSFPGIG